MLEPDADRKDASTQFGVAWRQTDRNQWNGLARYEHRLEESGQALSRSERDLHLVAGHLLWRPQSRWSLNGQGAIKRLGQRDAGRRVATNAALVGLRTQYDVDERFDAGVTLRLLGSDRLRMKQQGAGLEAGALLGRDLRLAAGYNVFGFHDADLAGADRTDRGPYLRIDFKFDESLLNLPEAH